MTHVQTNPHPSAALQGVLGRVVAVTKKKDGPLLTAQTESAKRSLKGRLVVKTLPAKQKNVQGLEKSAKKLAGTVLKISKEKKGESLEKLAAKIFEETLNLLSEVEVILVQMQSKNYQNQTKIAKTTVKVTHEVTQEHIQKIKKELAEYEKAKHSAKIMKIVGIVVACIALAIAAALGAGAFIACAVMVSLQESGAMNKMMSGLPLGAKIAVCIAMGVALGVAAGGADAAMFTAEDTAADGAAVGADGAANGARAGAEQVPDDVAENASNAGPKTRAEAFKGGAKFGFYNGTAQMLAYSNSIQDLTNKVFGKNDFSEWLGMILTIIITIAAALAGGTGGAKGGLAGQMAAKFGSESSGSMTMTRVSAALQTFQAGATIGSMVAEIQAANNYKDMRKTAKETAPILELEILLKSISTLMQTMEQQSTKLMKDDAKRFESDVKNLASIARPYEAEVRVLNASAA